MDLFLPMADSIRHLEVCIVRLICNNKKGIYLINYFRLRIINRMINRIFLTHIGTYSWIYEI